MIQYRFSDLDKLRRELDSSAVDKAARSTIKKATSKLRTHLSRRVRDRYTVAASVVARHSKLENFFASPRPRSILSYIGSKIGLVNFDARARNVKSSRGRRRGVTVKQLRRGSRTRVTKSWDRRAISDGFITTGANSNTHIFARQSSDRSDLISIMGPSVPEMVGHDVIQKDINTFLGNEVPRIFNSELNYFLEKQLGLRK